MFCQGAGRCNMPALNAKANTSSKFLSNPSSFLLPMFIWENATPWERTSHQIWNRPWAVFEQIEYFWSGGGKSVENPFSLLAARASAGWGQSHSNVPTIQRISHCCCCCGDGGGKLILSNKSTLEKNPCQFLSHISPSHSISKSPSDLFHLLSLSPQHFKKKYQCTFL